MTKDEAIKILDTIPTIGEQVDALEMAIEALEVREFGRWINLEKTKYKGQSLPFWGRYKCSECGEYGQEDFKFCPNCGARMVEPIGK